MNFYIDKAILEQAPRTRLAVVLVDDVRVGFGHPGLDEIRVRIVGRVRDEMRSLETLKMSPQLAGVEQLLGKFDSDARRIATQTEALLRKLLEGGHLPVENNAVDAAGLLALYYKLPVFLADRRDIKGNVGLVVGRETRGFEVLGANEPLRTEGRLFLTDDLGYFATPLARGKRGIVNERTKSLLLMALFPENVGDSIVRDFIRRGSNWFQSLCGGTVEQEGMVGEPERAGA